MHRHVIHMTNTHSNALKTVCNLKSAFPFDAEKVEINAGILRGVDYEVDYINGRETVAELMREFVENFAIIRKNIRKAYRDAKKRGVTRMSIANLHQITSTDGVEMRPEHYRSIFEKVAKLVLRKDEILV